MEFNGLIALIATLNPADLNFHAARYESADEFRELIRDVVDGGETFTPEELGQRVTEIAAATYHDGGNYLTIPCLGGEPQSVWESLCYAHKDII